jgi:hypothetical protein
MVRSQCRVLETSGGGIARHALTLRLSPAPGREAVLQDFFAALIVSLPSRPGLVGAHLLRHQAPELAATTEQKIRNGADRVADWVFVACGYALEALARLLDSELSAPRLQAEGAAPGGVGALYTLAASATPVDVRC